MVLKSAKTFIKPDGILIIKETVNTPRWKYKLCLVQERIALEWLRYTKGNAPYLPDPQLFESELNRAGFTVHQSKPIDFGYLWPHYLLVARLPRSITT